MKTVGAHTPCSCGYIQGGELCFYIKDYQAMCVWCSIKLILFRKRMLKKLQQRLNKKWRKNVKREKLNNSKL